MELQTGKLYLAKRVHKGGQGDDNQFVGVSE